MRVPDESHPITIEPNPDRVVVRRDGVVVADTTNALTLHEAHYPPVHYIPLVDVNADLIRSSDHTSYCPFKGDATYYDLVVGEPVPNAIWEYREPYDAVAQIEGHVAFYTRNVSFESS